MLSCAPSRRRDHGFQRVGLGFDQAVRGTVGIGRLATYRAGKFGAKSTRAVGLAQHSQSGRHESLRGCSLRVALIESAGRDRKSTRLNSTHTVISYAVFCLKKKKMPNSTVIAEIVKPRECTHI